MHVNTSFCIYINTSSRIPQTQAFQAFCASGMTEEVLYRVYEYLFIIDAYAKKYGTFCQ
jgi:hypothetical protein